MSFLVHNLSPVEVFVKKEYLYDHKRGHGELTTGVWTSVKSVMGFEVCTQNYKVENNPKWSVGDTSEWQYKSKDETYK